jgi:uncharacterized protein YmfQ (DUF2313 family)
MAVSAEAYTQAQHALLPPGLFQALGPNFLKLLDVRSEMLVRVHLRGDDLLREMDPRSAYELLPDYERVFGLPDPCAPEALSIADRRGAVIAKYTDAGLQTPAFFIQQAEAMGYAGAALEEFELCTCESDCEDTLYSQPWLHTFMLHLPADPPALGATCEGSCEDFLGAPPNTVIECLINRLKPEHTTALFHYIGV